VSLLRLVVLSMLEAHVRVLVSLSDTGTYSDTSYMDSKSVRKTRLRLRTVLIACDIMKPYWPIHSDILIIADADSISQIVDLLHSMHRVVSSRLSLPESSNHISIWFYDVFIDQDDRMSEALMNAQDLYILLNRRWVHIQTH